MGECDGMSGSVRISEFAEMCRLTGTDDIGPIDVYKRPSNKRDLGHRCKHCRRPFSTLGEDLIAGPEQGPTQRFHPECWKKRNQRYAGNMTRSRSEVHASGNLYEYADAAGHSGSGGVVTAYVEEWRRSAMEPSKRASRRRAGRARTRTSPLDGLVSIENECGERQIAQGFSKRAMAIAETRWKCNAGEVEECAVCLAYPEDPLRLPCGHIFCSLCVGPWLRRCALCPLCRQNLHLQADTHSENIREDHEEACVAAAAI